MDELQEELWEGNRIEVEARAINASDERYSKFVSAYFKHGMNATKAAVEAGYSEATACSQGSRLLQRPEIAAMVAEESARIAKELDYSAERTLKEVARIAFFDPRSMYRRDGTLKTVVELDDTAAAVLSSFEVVELYAGSGEERAPIGQLKKMKMWDKRGALDMLMRFHAQYKDKVQLEGELTLVVDV